MLRACCGLGAGAQWAEWCSAWQRAGWVHGSHHLLVGLEAPLALLILHGDHLFEAIERTLQVAVRQQPLAVVVLVLDVHVLLLLIIVAVLEAVVLPVGHGWSCTACTAARAAEARGRRRPSRLRALGGNPPNVWLTPFTCNHGCNLGYRQSASLRGPSSSLQNDRRRRAPFRPSSCEDF